MVKHLTSIDRKKQKDDLTIIDLGGRKARVRTNALDTITGLAQSIMSLAIASVVLGIATESLAKSGVLEPSSYLQSGLNRKEIQK